MVQHEVPVLVVGGGIVGLSASLFLAEQGISCLLVERHPGTSIHPRARGVNGRTMELMRELGLDESIRTEGAALADAVGFHDGRTLVEVLAARGDGPILRWMRRRSFRGGESKASPVTAARCTQDLLEPLLRKAAEERGVDTRFHHVFGDLACDADGVGGTVTPRDGAAPFRVHARYGIAADGARSPIREALGIGRSGAVDFGHQLNVYFRADLRDLVAGREFSMCRLEVDGVRGLLASINNADLWVLHVNYHPESGETAAAFPPERCAELVRKLIGLPELDVEIKGATPWQSAVRIADRYRDGAVFLAGDAAHAMPPWGGFGANTGVQDAHNLVWKLAAVLRGEASERLLDTYEIERRPVALEVGALSGAMNDADGLMRMPRGFGVLGLFWHMRKVFPYFTMGYGYTSGAVAADGGVAPGPGTTELRGRPGTRAPHVWLSREGRRLSTLDLFRGRFALLSTDPAWKRAADEVARHTGVAIDACTIGEDVVDSTGRWSRAWGVGRGASLVRPDGFVAWRTREPPGGDMLEQRLLSVLGRA